MTRNDAGWSSRSRPVAGTAAEPGQARRSGRVGSNPPKAGHRRGRLQAAIGAAVISAAAFSASLPVRASSALAAEEPIQVSTVTTTTAHRIDLGLLSGATSPVSTANTLPFIPRDAKKFARRKARPHASRGVAVTAPESGPPRTSQPVPAQVWPGQLSQDSRPPDTQYAAGPGQFLEMDDDQVEVFDRTAVDHAPFATASLGAFFRVPPGWHASDPRLLFDASSGLWFASALAWIRNQAPNSANYNSLVVLAVSQSTDATQGWNAYHVGLSSTLLCDQPRLGLSSDKVVVTCDNHRAADPLPTSTFTNEAAWVFDKGDLVSGNLAAKAVSIDLGSRFGVIPAVSLSSTSTEFMAYNDADPALVQDQSGPSVGVLAVTGVPGVTPVQLTESHPAVASTNIPPGAVQPGSSTLIQTDDDRIESAIWQNGVLWTSGNDSCVPALDTGTRACLRLTQVGTSGSTAAVTQSFDAAFQQSYLYFPALTMDAQGDLFCVYNLSSATSYVSLWSADQAVEAPTGSLGSATSFFNGLGPAYTGSWGHYSTAAIDPDAEHAWVGGAYPSSRNSPNLWQPELWEVVEAPVLMTIAPASGPAAGGQQVTIDGSHFLPGAEVFFGSTPAPQVTVVSNTQITALTPAAGVGTVPVSVKYADGITSLPPGGVSYTFS